MDENFVDYYKVLNIDIEATSIEIKNSYLNNVTIYKKN
jgi:DnaJ-class molecular chaperone